MHCFEIAPQGVTPQKEFQYVLILAVSTQFKPFLSHGTLLYNFEEIHKLLLNSLSGNTENVCFGSFLAHYP